MRDLSKSMSILLANLYALLIKTQNYHWHVSGPHFRELHLFFEGQYQELFDFIDDVAERMVTLGFEAPATLQQIVSLRTLSDGQFNISAFEMVSDLLKDYQVLVDNLDTAIDLSKKNEDEGNLTFLTDILVKVQKMQWMLRATSSGF